MAVHRFERVYGTVIVESERMDAALRIDGEDYGNVPRLLLLSSGKHELFLQVANAPEKTREVEIKVGYRTSVSINFAGGSPETKNGYGAKAESDAGADRRELFRIKKLSGVSLGSCSLEKMMNNYRTF